MLIRPYGLCLIELQLVRQSDRATRVMARRRPVLSRPSGFSPANVQKKTRHSGGQGYRGRSE